MTATREQLIELGLTPPDEPSPEQAAQAEARLKELADKARALGADGPVEQHGLAALKRALIEERDRMLAEEGARAVALEVSDV